MAGLAAARGRGIQPAGAGLGPCGAPRLFPGVVTAKRVGKSYAAGGRVHLFCKCLTLQVQALDGEVFTKQVPH